MNGIKKFLYGTLIGVVNIMLGAGGGMLTVPFYKKTGLSQKEAQINAVATMLPISIISAYIYIQNGDVKISDAYVYLIPGIIGSIAGTFFIKRISNKTLTILFAGFMIWAGTRLLFK